MRRFIIFLLLVFMSLPFYSQQIGKPIVKKPVWFRVSPPLREMIKNAPAPKKTGERHEVPNELERKIKIKKLNVPDALSIFQRKYSPKSILSINKLNDFDGINNNDNSNQVVPPDTQGDVSGQYYMQCVNNMTAIYDRNGNVVQQPFPTSNFWQGTGFDDRNDGDAVILWDEQAQRWLVTQFYVPENGNQYLLIAVSQTSDPTGSYYQYAYQYDNMPDYPKWAVWSDGYYMGANAFNSSGEYVGIYVSAFDRSAMLNGDNNAASVTFGPLSDYWSVFPADADAFPSEGTPCPFISDQFEYTSGNNKLYVFNFHVDWNNTSNSTFSLSQTLTVADYGFFNGDEQVPQPGTDQKLDLLQSRIMYRPYFRQFDDHQSLAVVRTVNDGGIAAIRWYELRRSSSSDNWNVYQQGTYNPGDGLWRWMPSIAINANGDIAIGYSVSSDSKYPSIRVVGRKADDPAGVMTSQELEIYSGNASQTGASRWGDYSMVSVDPTDNTSFWFTTEYTTGGWNWHTRIAHFELFSCDGPSQQASNFNASDIQDNSMTISWTRGNGDKVLVVARKGEPVNEDPVVGTNYNANAHFGDGDEIGQGNYVIYNGTGDNLTVLGLQPGTEYYFAIYEYFTDEYCYNIDELTGSATTTGIAPCEYCTVSSNDYDDATGITHVIFNTIDNQSSGEPAYSDYTDISTNVFIGQSYNLTVNVNTAGNYTVYAKVWIDWNHDCDFDDAGEEYDLGSANNVSDGSTSNSPLSITIPSDAQLGNTIMRIRVTYNTSPIACGDQDYSEAEDYTFIIDNCFSPSISQQPQDQTVSEGQSVSFSIEATGTDLTYQWYKDNDAISGATSNIYTINNVTLDDAGQYKCVVSNSCGSETSDEATLTVQAASTAVNELSVLGIQIYPNPSSGNINITLPQGESYNVEILSMNGKIIYQGVLNRKINKLNLGNQPSGIYVIHFYNAETNYVMKIVLK